ncbi:MAG: hypothetical protein O7C39_06460 [Bacteroidetes bacterium]|nr:hypothetical protein [Bacteroidota bacterium]
MNQIKRVRCGLELGRGRQRSGQEYNVPSYRFCAGKAMVVAVFDRAVAFM